MIGRREFITLLGGATAARPLAARAQQSARLRRIGVLLSSPEGDAEPRRRYAAFRQGLEGSGWIDGRNIQIDVRWGATDPERARALAKGLLSLQPDLVVVSNPVPLAAVVQQSRSIPIVFVSMSDPVETGFVQSFAQPGGNITGFTNFETKTAAKWLELLKEIAPGTSRAIVMRQKIATAIADAPEIRGLDLMRRVIEDAAPSMGIQAFRSEVRDAAEIESTIETFTREPNGGMIVLAGPILNLRKSIISQAARRQLPAIYPYRFYADDGGLLSYRVDGVDIYRRGATYVDRILRGEKPGNLPIQTPTKFELVINLKTAKTLGLDVPATLLARADEVIE